MNLTILAVVGLSLFGAVPAVADQESKLLTSYTVTSTHDGFASELTVFFDKPLNQAGAAEQFETTTGLDANDAVQLLDSSAGNVQISTQKLF